jgi:hypothetical protein
MIKILSHFLNFKKSEIKFLKMYFVFYILFFQDPQGLSQLIVAIEKIYLSFFYIFHRREKK